MATWLTRAVLGGAPTCVRSAKVGLLSTAVGFGIVLLVAVPSRYPGWLQIAAFAWMAVAVAWYAFWLGRLTGQGPGCAVERILIDDVWKPSASDDERSEVPLSARGTREG